MLSRNKKNIATASSVTIRTLRSGCLVRTLEASNWTQTLTLMRCAMPTSSSRNSSNPECEVSDFLRLSSWRLASRESLRSSSSLTPLIDGGIALSMMDRASTTEMSSSSDRCASVAALSSSCAMAKETEKARSEPTAVRAPALDMDDCDVYSATSSEIRNASCESASVQPLLAWQDGRRLLIRRLLVGSIAKGRPTGGGIKKDRHKKRFDYKAIVVGCVLQSALEFARGDARGSKKVLSILKECLGPASRSLATCTGDDAIQLKSGLASHRVIRTQLPLLKESNLAPRLDPRSSQCGSAAIGVSACLFFIFSVILIDSMDCGAFRVGAISAAEAAQAGMDRWISRCGSLPDQSRQALDAERRALQRGVFAMRVAKQKSMEMKENDHDAAHREVDYMRRAMWPCGKKIDARAQSDLCEWIFSPEFVEDSSAPMEQSASADALCALASSTGSDSSACTSLTSASSECDSVVCSCG